MLSIRSWDSRGDDGENEVEDVGCISLYSGSKSTEQNSIGLANSYQAERPHYLIRHRHRH